MPPRVLLRKTSLVDFPGKIAAVFFLPGCNLRCPWCHNRELILGGEADLVSIEDALAHLRKRRSVLGGVVLSGGEPCLHRALPDLVAEIKKFCLPVKLDTNGMFPSELEQLFGRDETRPDYIALDLKIAPRRYGELLAPGESAGIAPAAPGENLIKSAALIRESGIAHEYRTLALPGGFISEEDVEALAPLTDNAPWYFRLFRGGNCLDPVWDGLEEPLTEAAQALAEKARELGKNSLLAVTKAVPKPTEL